MLFLAACTFDAATKVTGLDTGSVAEDTGATEGGDTADTADTAAEGENPFETDDDGDGWSENGGDCDDADAGRAPGVDDPCNAVDDDCDGEVDEDANTGDGYEPNDVSAYALGSLDDDPDQALSAILKNDADVDRFSFTVVDDAFDFFTVTATLSDIPADANYRFTLNRLASNGDRETGEMAQVFGSGTLSLSFGDEALVDDGGTYELVVEAIAGADCAESYLLGIKQ